MTSLTIAIPLCLLIEERFIKYEGEIRSYREIVESMRYVRMKMCRSVCDAMEIPLDEKRCEALFSDKDGSAE